MIDPVTALTVAGAAYKGIKTLISEGQSLQANWHQLREWANAVHDVRFNIARRKREKPSLWKSITSDKTDTTKAFDIFIAQEQIRQQEKQIRHWFYWGHLSHLGADGYHRFLEMRRQMREERTREVHQREQMRRDFKKAFYEGLIWTFVILCLVATAGVVWYTYWLKTTGGS